MFVLGHIGIGRKLAAPWARGLPALPLVLGTLLPDLLDKSLYYGLSWARGLVADELGLISGTRTIGHTGFFLLGLSTFALLRRSRGGAALALGVATHLFLDNLLDLMGGGNVFQNGAAVALFFPVLGFRFPVTPHGGLGEHGRSLVRPEIIFSEILGLILLSGDLWKAIRLSGRSARALRRAKAGRSIGE